MASIRRRGNKWQVQFRRKGTSPVTRSFISRKDAESWSRQMEVQADRRELPADPKQLERHVLADLVLRYIETVTPRKRGCEIEGIVLRAFLRHPICARRLSELSPTDFACYRDERLRNIKPRSLQRQLSPIHNMFEIARKEWGLPLRVNPLDAIALDYPSNRRERRLREGEIERIRAAAEKTRNPIIFPIILFALETGLRRSEILQATWKHCDLSNRLLTITRAKNGHSRTIPLSLRLCEAAQGSALPHDLR